MPTPKVWTFTSVGGTATGSAPTVMVLSGWSAPFGRPRQGTIVNAGVTIRKNTTYYPGNSEPTVHSFGIQPKPWELHGRFMDQAIGAIGSVRQLRRQWFDFISAQNIVVAKWGDILSYRLFLHEMDLNFESESEIAWHLTGEVLSDEGAPAPAPITVQQTPLQMASLLSDIYGQAVPWTSPAIGNILNLLPELSDTLDDIVTSLNAPFAEVYDTCAALTDFETAASSDLAKIGGGARALNTGILNLRAATDALIAQADTVNTPGSLQPFGVLSSPDMITLTTMKAAADAQTANLLSLLATMQNQVDLASRGNASTAVQAQLGDTWETIATRTMGGPDGGRPLRDQNSVRHGSRPMPGKRYIVPSA